MTDNLQLAVNALQTALNQVRVVRTEHPGDALFNHAESALAEVTLNFVARQNHRSSTPPLSPADSAFYSV